MTMTKNQMRQQGALFSKLSMFARAFVTMKPDLIDIVILRLGSLTLNDQCPHE